MNVLYKIKPEKVFRFFEEISAVPRGSGHNDKIKEYCENFAKQRNLKNISDDAGNVIIFKDASTDCKSMTPVIIQGHLDMVWEKDDSCNINFETDGLELCVDGDYIYAKGTTLGGDDGIAVAMCLAILDSDDICHPPLEIVFTADEEIGMLGAAALDFSPIKSKRMINLDSEAEGTLWVSCAGGVRADISMPISYKENENQTYIISVSGLHGGHSGAEIHNGYANANKVMGKVLEMLSEKVDFNIVNINGGTMDNAITRDSVCIVKSSNDMIPEFVSEIYNYIKTDYVFADPQIIIRAEKTNGFKTAMSSESSLSVVRILNDLPNGVISMSKEIDGLVETSLNLGILKTEKDYVSFGFAVRSSIDSERDALAEKLKNISDKFSCNIVLYSEYPAWEYKKESELREIMSSIYKDMFNKEMTVTAIHAGLECGLFCGKINGLDCVSLGPDMFDIHTPKEHLSISSVERTWNFLLRVLSNI
ncbi:MAG: aminoacyl-histidine dipeptidase [Clostridia bacterium]|nr:aminoacyl-histidine dipeptidase [Clostridia bacterium]